MADTSAQGALSTMQQLAEQEGKKAAAQFKTQKETRALLWALVLFVLFARD